LPAQWLNSSSDFGTRLNNSLESIARFVTEPAIARRLRQLIMLLLCLWLALSVVKLFWALYPSADVTPPETLDVINPVSQIPTGAAPAPVDIAQLQSRHLFGEVSADAPAAPVLEELTAVKESREGIEKGARETRLQLVLRGVMASTQDGLGHAIIEFKKKQAVYAVEDELPVGRKVVLAKVMRRQVVLDNGGTYELLTLSEENELDTLIQPSLKDRVAVNRGADPDIQAQGSGSCPVGAGISGSPLSESTVSGGGCFGECGASERRFAGLSYFTGKRQGAVFSIGV